MKFSIETRDLTTLKTDLLAINMHDGKIDTHSFANSIDKKLGGELRKILKQEKFEGKTGQSRLINTHGKLKAAHVLVVGLGEKDKFDAEVTRKGGALVLKMAKKIRASNIVTAVHGGHLDKITKGECAQACVEGLILANYEFGKYKKKDQNAHQIKNIVVLCPSKKKVNEVRKGIIRGEQLALGTTLARDLVNTPANDMTPLALAKTAKSIKGIRTRILKKSQLEKLKMGSYLSVAQGSNSPPAFIEMHYQPKGKSKKTVCLIGKGVTFDSGGLCIKPPKYMETMKDDMAGAAAVIGLMSVVAKLKPKVEVWGFVAATENMPDAKSTKPGDVVRAMNGKSIEILNTDAEGRLTLADALLYASKKKPDYLIDTATLTGACVVALGERYSAIMGNDEDLIKKLTLCGSRCGEKLWQLPLPEEYKAELKSTIADLKNIGGAYAGTIIAGLFLQEFVGKNKWAHIDIAGPSWTDKPREYETRGGTGVMVRTFAEFLDSI